MVAWSTCFLKSEWDHIRNNYYYVDIIKVKLLHRRVGRKGWTYDWNFSLGLETITKSIALTYQDVSLSYGPSGLYNPENTDYKEHITNFYRRFGQHAAEVGNIAAEPEEQDFDIGKEESAG